MDFTRGGRGGFSSGCWREGRRRITLVAAAKDDLPAEAWWQSAQGFAVIGGEYLKLGFYVLRYSYLAYGVAVVVLWWLSWRVWVHVRVCRVSCGGGYGTAEA